MEIENINDLNLIVALTLEDIEDFNSSSKGKNREDIPVDDREFAVNLLKCEAELLQQQIEDYRLAVSIDQALSTDQNVLVQESQLEKIAESDRQFAIRLSQSAENQSYSSCSPSTSESFGGGTLQVSKSHNPVAPIPSSSRAPDSVLLSVDCVICQSSLFLKDAIRVPCSNQHYWDVDCLKKLFITSTHDETLMPPRCCDSEKIPHNLIRSKLSKSENALFRRKCIEYATKQRVYCHDKTCSEFLGPQSITGAIAFECHKCDEATCSSCKTVWEDDEHVCEVIQDAATAALLKRQYKFQRCPGCGRVVELRSGCYHIYCVCKYEFCYLCGTKWKGCTCTEADEHRIMGKSSANENHSGDDL